MDEMGYVMQDIIRFGAPALILFLSQTALCLWCENKYIRLIPTVIALGISLYHIGIIIAEAPHNPWAVLAWGYWLLTALPSLIGVFLAWGIYVVKLMIREFRALKRT